MEAETVLVAVNELAGERPSLGNLDDAALVGYRARLIDLAARAMSSELAVAAAAAASYRRLEGVLGRYAGDAQAAADARQLTAGAGTCASAMPQASRSVFAGRTWAETGGIPMARPAEPAWPDRQVDRRNAQLEIERRLRRHPRWRRNRALTGQVIDVQLRGLRAAVNDATAGLARREEVKAAVLLLGGLVRSANLELGRRLGARGYLKEPGDVDLLRDAELRAAMAGHRPARGVLLLRRRWRDRYEQAGELPQRFVGVPPPATPPALTGRIIRGWAASGGRFTGRARALTEPVGESLNPGDVLVASATDSAWTPVFAYAGAIVIERGGPLSHAAVVARELGLPAVLNVPGAATHVDGRMVTVDGDNGQVIVHDAQPSAALVPGGATERRPDGG